MKWTGHGTTSSTLRCQLVPHCPVDQPFPHGWRAPFTVSAYTLLVASWIVHWAPLHINPGRSTQSCAESPNPGTPQGSTHLGVWRQVSQPPLGGHWGASIAPCFSSQAHCGIFSLGGITPIPDYGWYTTLDALYTFHPDITCNVGHDPPP